MKRICAMKEVVLALIAGCMTWPLVSWADYTDDCLTFSSEGGFSISADKGWNTLYWSTNKTDWTVWSGAAVCAAEDGGTGKRVLYFRGTTANTKVTASIGWKVKPDGENKIACTGNIETLRGATGSNPSPTKMAECCYADMFDFWTSLTEAPALPATQLANWCYANMFYNCTSLTNAPVLPAKAMSAYCYSGMFMYCSSLAVVPELPATELAQDCYSDMFCGCTALEKAPELPATCLGDWCYYEMFYGCTSLTTAPELPAMIMWYYSYYNMFYGCSSLTNTPALPATWLDEGCYMDMFRGCTSLKDVPALPATRLADYCYCGMFRDCASLEVNENVPGKEWKIPTTTGANGWGMNMFKDTGGIVTGQPALNKTYYIASMCEREIGLDDGMKARDYGNGDFMVAGKGEVSDASALAGEGVTNLWIGAGVTGIGSGAFLACDVLERVRFASEVAVAPLAFNFTVNIRMNGTTPEAWGRPVFEMPGYETVVQSKPELTDACEWVTVTNQILGAKQYFRAVLEKR